MFEPALVGLLVSEFSKGLILKVMISGCFGMASFRMFVVARKYALIAVEIEAAADRPVAWHCFPQ